MASVSLASTSEFLMSRNELIAASLRVLGKHDPETSLKASDIRTCAEALNLLVKDMMVQGLRLWTVERRTFDLVAEEAQYYLGPAATTIPSYTVVSGGTGYDQTSDTVAVEFFGTGATSPANAIDATSGGVVTAVTATNIGLGYSAGNPPDVTIFSTGGTGAVVTPNVLAGSYGLKPLRVLTAYVTDIASERDTTLKELSQDQYFALGSKVDAGVPHSFWADWQHDNAIINMYNVPATTGTHTATFVVQRSMLDVNLATQNVDVPREWLRTMKWLLADEISLEYGADETVIKMVQDRANEAARAMNWWDSTQQNTSVYFSASGTGRGVRGSR